MGIQNLSKLIAQFAPNAQSIVRLEDLQGTILAVDVSNFMYQFAYNAANKKPNYHLAGFFQMTYELAQHNILPVMILDGMPTADKDHILKQRQDRQTATQEKIADAQIQASKSEDHAEAHQHAQTAKRLEKQIIDVTHTMWEEVRELFELMGVPTLQAQGEADILASHLCQQGLVDGVISEDMDHLVFGTTALIRDFNVKRTPDLIRYHLPTFLEESGLTREQFADIAIMCGCDYTPKINGIAWKRAYQLVKEHGSLAGVVEHIRANSSGFTKFEIPEGFAPEVARGLFLSTSDITNSVSLVPKKFQSEQLKPLLMSRCNYRSTTLDPKFNVIENMYRRRLQKAPITPPEEQPTRIKIPVPKIRI